MKETLELNINNEADRKLIRCIADALSNDKRMELLNIIKECDKEDLSHKKLAEKIGVKSPSITFHIKSLVDAELIKEELVKGLKGRNKKIPIIDVDKIVIIL